jgi:hypothetical protein
MFLSLDINHKNLNFLVIHDFIPFPIIIKLSIQLETKSLFYDNEDFR